eukprot:688335-Alexandrium_andersonii.AAC.1
MGRACGEASAWATETPHLYLLGPAEQAWERPPRRPSRGPWEQERGRAGAVGGDSAGEHAAREPPPPPD